jgi:hypothetical protein
MSRRFSIVALLTASLFLCLTAGCWNPFKPDKDDGGGGNTQELLPRTSPENVLFNFRIIYGDKDNVVNTTQDANMWAENYRTLFHPDTFTFWFIPGDQPPDIPDPWWGLNEEVTSFDSMLVYKAWGSIDDITLSWTINPSEPDVRFDPETQELLHPTWRHILVTGILLDVIAGVNTYRVPNGTADFYLAPDPANSTLWVITEWYDHQPVGGSPPSRAALESVMLTTSAPEYSSWGRIKALNH